MIPRIYNHSYAISADLVVPEGGAEGVIVAEADHLGGFTLDVEDGKLTHTYSMMGVFVFKQVAEEELPTGEVTVRMEFAADEAKPATGGEVTLFIGDRPVGKGRMDHTVPIRFSAYAGMDIGRDNGGVVDLAYEDRKPFAFTGTVKKVVFDIKPHLSDQDEMDMHAETHRGHAAHGLSG
jgi:arylsulfatase